VEESIGEKGTRPKRQTATIDRTMVKGLTFSDSGFVVRRDVLGF
jgi:hypothetical protein